MGSLLGMRRATDWLHSRVALPSTLNYSRQGVPLILAERGVYTEVWRFVFGIANRTLVEQGFFADPYDEHRSHQRFIPVIFAKGIDEFP